GENVAATTRSTTRLLDALSGVDTDTLLPLEVELTDSASVNAAVTASMDHFGRLDVVVNNAGYGYLAAVEETTDADIRRMFDVQVIGSWNVVRSALPHLREAQRGHIINISSILGLTAVPGWGLYCAAKFALTGMSEALAGEVVDFGIKVSIVEPGYFRTSFLTPDALALPSAVSTAYPAIREMTKSHLELQGHQLGDPAKGAAAIIGLAGSNTGPLHQLLGTDSVSYARAKIQSLTADVEAGLTLASTTDHR
ncbi:MAG: short-chain dehydrogenase/reductase, partial [Mycobacterium sp.]|nr:short-chain dehydrogenase/reductase [Mycobacterium sp.]